MKNLYKSSAYALVLFTVVSVCVSCTKEPCSNISSEYKTEELSVLKNGIINELDTNEYTMKVEACLSVPDSSTILSCCRMKYDDGHYYLQSEGKNQTIWVFDSVGNFVSKLGERGRRKNEYQTDITDWFHVNGSDDVIVYERKARKVHVFSLDGSQSESFTLESSPNAVGVLDRGKLFCSFYQKEAKEGLQLAILTENEDIASRLIFLGQDMEFIPSDYSFYKIKDELFHVPCFADSAIVFRGDTVERVVKFRFEDEFITKEIKEKAFRDELESYRDFTGIKSITTYYETSRYNVLSFVLGSYNVNQLVDKTDGRQYRFIGSLPKGLSLSTEFCVRGDKIYYVITKENVEETRTLSDADVYEGQFKQSCKTLRDIYSGKVQLPAIVSIEIK